MRLQPFPCNFERPRVAVQPDQTSRRQPPRDFQRMTARAHRRIHIRPLRPYAQPLHDQFSTRTGVCSNAQT